MENKKKTLVPIIIGITLLVLLVIGATYAYFQATNSASGTTSVEASTEKIGTVVVTNPTENLYMKLSAYDMQESKAGTSYYATDDSSKRYETEAKNYPISEYSVSGGEADTVYNCTYKLNITKPSQIQSGDMQLKLNLNGATIDGNSSLDIDLANVSSTYTVTFMKQGNSSGTLVSGDIVFNNTITEQTHLVGQTLSTVITNSELNCEVSKSICAYDETSEVEEGEYGAKYNCLVDPNKDTYAFYLIDNNDDGTSDLIMSHNINASGENVIPGESSDLGMVEWYTDAEDNSYGPITAMTYLYNATKSWTNVVPLNFTYDNLEYDDQGIESYRSFISVDGIGIIENYDETTATIGTSSEPLRARMPVYIYNSTYSHLSEVSGENNTNSFLYNNLDPSFATIYTYWTMTSASYECGKGYVVYKDGDADGNGIFDEEGWINGDFEIAGVRPVITVSL